MIVITTPTGRIGRQVLDGVLESGEPLRVIVRDATSLPEGARERVEVVEGSHGDPGGVTAAFEGADSVFWVVPPNPRIENVRGYYADFTRPACEAIKEWGVRRVVAVSSLGRRYPGYAGLLSEAFALEEQIEETDVALRALRMPFFMENLLGQAEAIRTKGVFFMANSADRALATVATRDVATVAAGLLLDGSWTGQEGVSVVGPDELSPNEMARVMSEVLGRPVRFQGVSAADYKATLVGYGLSEAWAQGILDMVAAQNEGIYDGEKRTARPGPTGFREWCEDTLKPSVLASG